MMLRQEASTSGSSPLTRGKHRRNRGRSRSPGLIPAHAGKTRNFNAAQILHGAHPRSRGENSNPAGKVNDCPGSSPLTRGKRSEAILGQIAERLIPAHAGKTPSMVASIVSRRAHPRSRGENAVDGGIHRVAAGSSPLTRGKRLSAFIGSDTLGLIPAHAGKTHV